MWVTFNHLLALTSESIRSLSPLACFLAAPAQVQRSGRSHVGAFLLEHELQGSKLGSQGEWASPARGTRKRLQGIEACSPFLPAVGSFGHKPGPSDADEAPECGEDDDREGKGMGCHGWIRDAQAGYPLEWQTLNRCKSRQRAVSMRNGIPVRKVLDQRSLRPRISEPGPLRMQPAHQLSLRTKGGTSEEPFP